MECKSCGCGCHWLSDGNLDGPIGWYCSCYLHVADGLLCYHYNYRKSDTYHRYINGSSCMCWQYTGINLEPHRRSMDKWKHFDRNRWLVIRSDHRRVCRNRYYHIYIVYGLLYKHSVNCGSCADSYFGP